MRNEKGHLHLSAVMRLLCGLVLPLIVGVALLLGAPKPAYGPGASEDARQLQCIVSAVYHEARGEPVKGKRAVVDTIFNRAIRSGKTVCEVVAKRQQFPWFKKKGLVQLTEANSAHYNEAMSHPKVLKDTRYVFFNGVKPPGEGCMRIGNHTFCREVK